MTTSDPRTDTDRDRASAIADHKRAAWATLMRALGLSTLILGGAILLLWMVAEIGGMFPAWLGLLLGLVALVAIMQGGFLYPLFSPAMTLCRIYLAPFPRLRTTFAWLASGGLVMLLLITAYAVFATDWLINHP